MYEVLDVLMASHLMDSELSSLLAPVVSDILGKFPIPEIHQVFVGAGWDVDSSQFCRPIQREQLFDRILLFVSTLSQLRGQDVHRSNGDEPGTCGDGNVPNLPQVTFRRDARLPPVTEHEYYDYCSQCSKDDYVVKCEACALVRHQNPAMWSQQKLRQEAANLAELYHMPSPVGMSHVELHRMARQHMLPERVLDKLIEYAEYMTA